MGYSISRIVLIWSMFLFSVGASADNKARWGEPAWQPPRHHQNPVSIEIIDDRGRVFNKHQSHRAGHTHRAYLEAKQGKRYRIKIRNRTNKRIGIVVAVDGRNIISGKKSRLRHNERMYVLGPRQSATYKGWRTGKNKVNRFYFTDAGDSYSASWGDYSAMGVIAAAVYAEKPRPRPRPQSENHYRSKPGHGAMSSAREKAGTGFGREEYSASRRVKFKPQRRVSGKYFYKYEWRETLCERGVINCYWGDHEHNRFWPYESGDRDSYAPYPPSYRQRNR